MCWIVILAIIPDIPDMISSRAISEYSLLVEMDHELGWVKLTPRLQHLAN